MVSNLALPQRFTMTATFTLTVLFTLRFAPIFLVCTNLSLCDYHSCMRYDYFIFYHCACVVSHHLFFASFLLLSHADYDNLGGAIVYHSGLTTVIFDVRASEKVEKSV